VPCTPLPRPAAAAPGVLLRLLQGQVLLQVLL
jgi:hypothetical protein